MADVITRFKLETTQFDSKLRDAAKGLKEYTHQAELGGKSFTNFSQKSIEAARSLGTIASGANNAKDKVKDLVGAYNDAANAYNKLSQEQQQSDFGKALSQSIGQLSDRVKEAKRDLYDLNDAVEKVKSSGGLFGEGGLTGMMQVMGGNLLAQGITMLGSELAGTISQSIELARQGEGVRMAFERLNKPGLLDNLKEATHGTVSELELMKAAVKFDDFKLPVEELGTLLEFAQKKAKDTGQSVDYMVDSIVTGLGRKSLMILDNLGLSAAQIKDKMKEGGDMTKAVAEIIKEQMSEAGEYVETAADRAARAAADAQNQMEELGRTAMPVAEEWASVWNEIKTGGMEVLTFVLSPIADSIRSIRELLSQEYTLKIKEDIPNLADGPVGSVFNNTPGSDHKVTALGGYVVVTDKSGKQIGAKHFDSFDGGVVDTWKQTLSTKSGGRSGSKTDPTEKIQSAWDKAFIKSMNTEKLKSEFNHVSVLGMFKDQAKFDPQNILGSKDAWESYKDTITGTVGDISESLSNLSLENWSGEADVEKFFKKLVDDGKKIKSSWGEASSAISGVGSALSSIEDPGAKIAMIVAQGIASVVAAFGDALSEDRSSKSNIWAFLGAAATSTAQMLTMISQIHSATGYAEGGVIKGNHYSGDMEIARVNAGETILTRAQSGVIAGALEGNSLSNLNLTAEVKAERLLFSLNANGRRTGHGELVTAKFR